MSRPQHPPVNARGLGRRQDSAAELAPPIAELEARGALLGWPGSK